MPTAPLINFLNRIREEIRRREAELPFSIRPPAFEARTKLRVTWLAVEPRHAEPVQVRWDVLDPAERVEHLAWAVLEARETALELAWSVLERLEVFASVTWPVVDHVALSVPVAWSAGDEAEELLLLGVL